jgi:exodeoxyribonuclease VII large subunit
VQRIAVISSRKAAGWQDFHNELFRYGYTFAVTLHEAVMQGESSEESIIAALEQIAQAEESYDAVVIIRGGGSTSDLNCFNSYRLSSHIAQFPLPVITGIGHDKDVSVADMVAHTMLKTPTAVAVWLNDRLATLEAALDNAALQLHELCTSATHRASLLIERHTAELRLAAERLLTSQTTKVETLTSQLHDNTRLALEAQAQRLRHLEELAESQSPERILQLGFAVARVGGKAIISKGQVCAGDIVTIEVTDGIITTKSTE